MMQSGELLLELVAPNHTLLGWLFAASLALVFLTPIGVALAVVQLPADYFTEVRRRPLGSWDQHPFRRAALLLVKNLFAIFLVIAGVVMLIMPGQGLLTIAVGLILLDFPGKFRLERWLATRAPVWRSLNWLRQRAGSRPLKKPA